MMSTKGPDIENKCHVYVLNLFMYSQDINKIIIIIIIIIIISTILGTKGPIRIAK